ncbi:replication-associated recombination protein A [Patescibacteria group bacterium]|nr:replication-associated recombination protein A [Patescibacteria group bacterium]
MDLFDKNIQQYEKKAAPLADRMRPKTLNDFIGQSELVGKGKVLRQMIEDDTISSMLFWGPPGSGKTTLAKIIAKESKTTFVPLSAVSVGKKKVIEVCTKAYNDLKFYQKRTILFLDEIHRFNKAQQDTFLPFVEKGIITLIGATTENPSFEINNALLSRCQVFVFNTHSEEDIRKILSQALSESEWGLGTFNHTIEPKALDFLANVADGDARTALSTLELASQSVRSSGKKKITLSAIEGAIQKRALLYDKKGEEHYNIISALHKSMRNSDPDATLYWLERMLQSGEDPRYILRRMIRFASEDVGLADPNALTVAVSALSAYECVGLPEGSLALAECAVYLAKAPKDNSLYVAEKQVQKDIKEKGALPVPKHIRNSPTKLMKDLDYGKGYKYAHDFKNKKTDMQCMPDELKGKKYF